MTKFCNVLSNSFSSYSFWHLTKNVSNNVSSSSLLPLLKLQWFIPPSLPTKLNSSLKLLPPVPPCTILVIFLLLLTSCLKSNFLQNMFSPMCAPDVIPPVVLNNCVSERTPCLGKLFHFYLSSSTSTFSSCWKFALIQPVPKKGNHCQPSNYSPIVLLSCLFKVFETILNIKKLLYLVSNNLLSDCQYGFSTGDLLSYLSN